MPSSQGCSKGLKQTQITVITELLWRCKTLQGLIPLLQFPKEDVGKNGSLMTGCQLAQGEEEQGSSPGTRERAQKLNRTLLYEDGNIF